MDFLEISIEELKGLWDAMDCHRVLFHPVIAPDGQINRMAFRELHNSQDDCIIIIDNNLLIDLVKLNREGCLRDTKRMKFVAMLMLWVEINRLSMTSGQALQEKAVALDSTALSADYSAFREIWANYTPQQWFSLWRGVDSRLPVKKSPGILEFDMSKYQEIPDAYYYTYASMLRLVILLRDNTLHRFDRAKAFIEWSYQNTLIGKYVLAYALLLFMEKDQGIKVPKRANSNNIDEILNGCKNQAWDLEGLSTWSQLLDLKERGEITETFIFATEDELLKKVIMSVVRHHDMSPLLRHVFSRAEYQEVIELVAKENTEERLKRRDSFVDKQYLHELVEHEEKVLRGIVSETNAE